MLFEVDPGAAVPLYEQVASSVRRQRADGRIAIGSRLPPARQVAESLQINLHTVLRAYQQLRDEGLIELRRGRGAVVTASEPAARLGNLVAELRAEARRLGLTDEQLVRLVEGGSS